MERNCVRCGHPVLGNFFKGISGMLCEKCLKDMQVYSTLRGMGLIQSTEEVSSDAKN